MVKLIASLITAARVAGFDETTLRAGPAGQKKYVLGAFTEDYSLLHLGDRDLGSFRDFGILPDFAGVVVSDRYVNYWHAGWENVAGHQACLSHILRDYQDAAETYPDAHWPAQAQRALRGLIHAWNDARDNGLAAIPADTAAPLITEFRRAVTVGLSAVPRIPGPKNSTAQHPGRDLLEFSRDREDDVLRLHHRHQDLADEQHQRARRAAHQNPAEDLRPAHQRRRHPGPARHPQLHRHRPQARPPAPRRAPQPVHREPLATAGPRPGLTRYPPCPNPVTQRTSRITYVQPGECLPAKDSRTGKPRVQRPRTARLRCGGHAKQRLSCGDFKGIVAQPILDLIAGMFAEDDTPILAFQRVAGNAHELDALNAELRKIQARLSATEDDDELDALVADRKAIKARIEGFVIVPDSFDYALTGQTVAQMWNDEDDTVKRGMVPLGGRDKGNRDRTAKPGDRIGFAHRIGCFLGQLRVFIDQDDQRGHVR